MATKFSVSFDGDDDSRKEVERRNEPASPPRGQAASNSNTDKLDRKQLLQEAKQLEIAGRTRLKNNDLKSAIDEKKKALVKPDVLSEARMIETNPFVPPEDKANYRKFLLAEAKKLNIPGRTRMKNEVLAEAVEAQRLQGALPKAKSTKIPSKLKVNGWDVSIDKSAVKDGQWLVTATRDGHTLVEYATTKKEALSNINIAIDVEMNNPWWGADEDLDDSFDTDALDEELRRDAELKALNDPDVSPSSPEATESDLLSYEGGGGEPPVIPPGTLQADMPDDEDGNDPELFSHSFQGGDQPSGSNAPSSDSEPELFSHQFQGGDQPSGPVESLPDFDIPFNPKEDPKKARKIVEAHERKQKADEARRIRSELTAAKRRADKQNVINSKNEKLRRRAQKNAITESAKANRALLKEQADRGDADRLTRRLTSFGIGRAAGIDGGLVTALAEILIVQPEVAAAEEQFKIASKKLNEDVEQQSTALESAKVNTSINRDRQSLEIAETIDEARLALAEGEDVNPDQVEKVLNKILDKDVEIDPSTGMPKSASSGTGYKPNFTFGGNTWSSGPGGGGGGFGGGGGNNYNTGGGSSGGPGGGGFGGNQPTGLATTTNNNLNTATGSYIQSMAASTRAMLGVYIGLTALKEVSESVTEGIERVGEILTTPESVSPMVAGLGDAGKLGGMAAGTVIGMSIGGPVGMVAGTIIGKSISAAIIDPLVSLVQTAEVIMGSAVKSSIGPQTILAKVEAQVELLNQRLYLSDQLDSETASYVTATNGFERSINDLKAVLIPIIRPIMEAVVLGLTKLSKIVELIILMVDSIPFIQQIKASLDAYSWWQQQLLDTLDRILAMFNINRNKSSATITNAIYDFFGGNSSAASSGSMPANVQRNTPSKWQPGLYKNIDMFSFPRSP